MHTKLGHQGMIHLKMNSLSDFDMVDKLYEASRAGVKIKLQVRGICSLIPGVPGMSDNIEAISIVDNYLEHTRVYIFGNNGDPEVFISSADFMTRNLDTRVEVACPIYDPAIKQELIDVFDMGWKGNVKARFHSQLLDNKYRQKGDNPVFRAQLETYNYYKQKADTDQSAAEQS
jgi:polyphosphate kinase